MPLERLILLRHGAAENRAASGRDFDRALSERGRAEARQTGRRLADMGVRIDLALVSGALRTRQTWEQAGAAYPQTRVEAQAELYNASAEGLIAAAETSGAAQVVVVGHNPSIHALAAALSAQGSDDPAFARRLHDGFVPGTAAVFRFEGGLAVCEALIVPQPSPPMTRIYEILTRAEWDDALGSGVYEGSEVDRQDGFIHFSAAGEAQETARKYFSGRADLVIVTLEAETLGGALKWEPSRGGALFPHLYEPLPTLRALDVRDLPLDADGVPDLGILIP